MPRRVRIAIIGSSPCRQCTSACCRRTVSEFAVLLETEAERRRFAAWAITLPVVDDGGTLRFERVLPYGEDGRCRFLGGDGLCEIYDDRPGACRAFECTRHFDPRREHGAFLRGNAGVVELLERC